MLPIRILDCIRPILLDIAVSLNSITIASRTDLQVGLCDINDIAIIVPEVQIAIVILA